MDRTITDQTYWWKRLIQGPRPKVREGLRARHYDVFEIAASDLDDRDAMAQHSYRLACALMGQVLAGRFVIGSSDSKAPGVATVDQAGGPKVSGRESRPR